MKHEKRNEITLQELIEHLAQCQAAELFPGSMGAAQLMIDFLRRPANEITLGALKEKSQYFRLYLHYLRVPWRWVDVMQSEVDKLIREGEALSRARSLADRGHGSRKVRRNVA